MSPRKGNTTRRGYGSHHQRTRARLLPHAYGQPCARCGEPMHQGQELHLDHNDNRHGYLGFSHAECNERAGTAKRDGTPTPEPRPASNW